MTFEKRFEAIIEKSPVRHERHLWVATWAFSLAVFLTGAAYLAIRRGTFDLYIANKVLASTGVFLIGLSLVLSAICYFWNALDTKIVYRKHLGVIGFLFALAHAALSLWGLPDHFGPASSYLSAQRLPTFIPAVLALAIFAGMTAISNNYAVHELGGKAWRRMLRLGGYLGFILVLLHFVPMKKTGWTGWLSEFSPLLPPLSLLVFIFAAVVLVLRIALEVAVRSQKPEATPANPTQSSTPPASAPRG